MEWPTWGGGQVIANTSIDGASDTFYLNIPASASANVKGAWIELMNPIPFDTCAIGFGADAMNAGDYLVDLGLGAVGSESPIVNNFLSTHTAETTATHTIMPLRFPKGGRLVGRIQSTINNGNYRAQCQLISGDFQSLPGFQVVVTAGADTSDSGGTLVDPGAVLNTRGSWAELIASVPLTVKAMTIGIGSRANATPQNANYLLDIGIGPSGSEIVIIPSIALRNFSTTSTIHPNVIGPFSVNIPKGSRLAARAQSNITDATDRLFDVVVYLYG